MDSVSSILTGLRVSFYRHDGIATIFVKKQDEGLTLAKYILYETVSRKTVGYLSGGRTPKELYESLAKEEKIMPGAVALVDERYGEPLHDNSNERMLRESGLTRYLQMRDIQFFSVLKGKSREQTTADYDQKLRELFATYQKHVAILGVGVDGHTAGIPADPQVWDEFHIGGKSKTEMVIDYDDHGKFYNQRVSMSFLALSHMDVLLVLVFGADKKRSLEWMFADGPEDQVPSRFFKRADIAPKTLLITDCNLSF